jgi:nucleoside triphosphatase
MTKLPKVAAGAIIKHQNKIFLMKSSGKFGFEWIIPGGKVNYQERVEDCLIREIKEETNMDIYNIKFLGYRDYIKKDKHFIFLEFLADTDEVSKITLNYEATEYRFFSQKDLEQIDVSKPTMDLINTYRKNIFL